MCWLSVLYVFQQLVKFCSLFQVGASERVSDLKLPGAIFGDLWGGWANSSLWESQKFYQESHRWEFLCEMWEPTAHNGRSDFGGATHRSFNGRPLVRPDSEQVQYIDVIWFMYVLDLTVYDVLSMHIIAYQYMHINWCIFTYFSVPDMVVLNAPQWW